jgi:hypothetical protein
LLFVVWEVRGFFLLLFLTFWRWCLPCYEWQKYCHFFLWPILCYKGESSMSLLLFFGTIVSSILKELEQMIDHLHIFLIILFYLLCSTIFFHFVWDWVLFNLCVHL